VETAKPWRPHGPNKPVFPFSFPTIVVFNSFISKVHLSSAEQYTIMSSMLSKIMEPGGGVMLLPFVRLVICFLLMLTVTGAIVGVARLHMIILSFLSSGECFGRMTDLSRDYYCTVLGPAPIGGSD